jgi:ribokinase
MPAQVLVVGSLHFDILVASDRLPRLGETFAGSAWTTKCGGKGGNQAIEAARHGAATAMVACVGNDEFGLKLKDNLAGARVDTRFVSAAYAGSGISVAISDAQGDYGAVIVTGSNAALAEAEVAAALQTLARGSVLVLQNEVPEAVNIFAARGARAAGARVVINAAPARPMPLELLEMTDVLIVNAVEAEMLGGGEVHDLASAAAAARRLAAGIPAVIVTAGGHGLALCGPEGTLTISPHAVSLVSTHGAGDAFVGALAAQLAAGTDLQSAAHYANAAAALLVSTPEADRRSLSKEDTERLLPRRS